MQFPMLAASEMDVARVHRHNPHDLHWRKQPPAWPGRVDSAYRRLYPHLVDEFCCMQCGAIPCPFDHAEDRDTRLQDMSFVGNLVREKKAHEGQLTQLKEKLHELEEAKQKWNSEKQKLQKSLCEKQEIGKRRESEKTALMQEASKLRMNNAKLQQEIHSSKKDLERIEVLEGELERLKLSHEQLTEQCEHQRKVISSHSANVKDAERAKRLEEELLDLRRNFEATLETRILETEAERRRATDELDSKTLELHLLRERLNESEATEFNSLSAVLDLRNELEAVKVDLDGALAAKRDLERRLEECEGVIERLRQRMTDDTGFQRYVGVLRELNHTKDTNEELMWQLGRGPSVALTSLGPEGQHRRSSTIPASTNKPNYTPARANTRRRRSTVGVGYSALPQIATEKARISQENQNISTLDAPDKK